MCFAKRRRRVQFWVPGRNGEVAGTPREALGALLAHGDPNCTRVRGAHQKTRKTEIAKQERAFFGMFLENGEREYSFGPLTESGSFGEALGDPWGGLGRPRGPKSSPELTF